LRSCVWLVAFRSQFVGIGVDVSSKKAGHYSGHFTNNTLKEYPMLHFGKVTISGDNAKLRSGRHLLTVFKTHVKEVTVSVISENGNG
jgi:hypothetical protein